MLDNLFRLVGALGRPQAAPESEAAAAPRHVAIIMDGNGRWATRRGLPRVAGHRAGVEALRRTVRAARELGLGVLTVYAFSTENWQRPQEEVDTLMRLVVEYCRAEAEDLRRNGVRVKVIGRLQELPMLQQREIAQAMEHTRDGTSLVLNVAWNYGARAELVDAFRSLLSEVQAGRLRPEDVDAEQISRHLYTADLPDPDLIIRSGGEMRLSNFLLWQAAYAEFWSTPVLWPDFNKEHLAEALAVFAQRERRFGAIKPTKSR